MYERELWILKYAENELHMAHTIQIFWDLYNLTDGNLSAGYALLFTMQVMALKVKAAWGCAMIRPGGHGDKEGRYSSHWCQ